MHLLVRQAARVGQVREAARELNCKPETLYNRGFRAQLGLAGVRIGRHIKFDTLDIQRVIEARKEQLPIMPSEYSDDAA